MCTVIKEIDKEMFYTPDSPKVTRERKAGNCDVSSVRSPKAARRERGDVSMHKAIYDSNTISWALRYHIENNDFAKGAYGKILLATDRTTQQRVVIKKIPQTTPIRMINNEVRAGKAIAPHPNIAQLYQYIDRPDHHFLIFQHINGQDLFNFLEKQKFVPRKEDDARSMITQICKALEHIHSHSIAHRDIKLENILIDAEGRVTVIDFGLCAFVEEGKLHRDWCGSDNYLAPEIVRRIPYNGYLADVFSTGVVLFALLFGVFPFEGLRVNSASMDPTRRLKPIRVRFPSDVKVSESAKDLLRKMLEEDPTKRCSMMEVLKHDWMCVSQEESPRVSLRASCEAAP